MLMFLTTLLYAEEPSGSGEKTEESEQNEPDSSEESIGMKTYEATPIL